MRCSFTSWILYGFVAGLVASSFMISYWFYHLRKSTAEKEFRHTSRLWAITWIAVFFGSTIGLMRELKVIQEGSMIDSILLYTSATLYYVALAALVAGLILDAAKKIEHRKKASSLRDNIAP